MVPKIISVIIPVYNTAPYLSRCLDSILQQTYTHLEIILLNDASTDHSGDICNQYAAQDKRIRAFHFSQHIGVWIRNYGIEQAKGDYLSFIDSDDSIGPETYQTAIQLFEQYPEINLVRWNIRRIFSDTGFTVPNPYIFPEGLLEQEGIFALLKSILQNQEGHNVCNCLFPVSLIKKYKVFFPKNIVMGDDACFLVSFLIHCKKIYLLPQAYFYNYFQNKLSVSHRFSEKDIQYDLNFTHSMQQILKQPGVPLNLLETYNRQLKYTLFGLVLKLARMHKPLQDTAPILQAYCQQKSVQERWEVSKTTSAKWYDNITFFFIDHKFYKIAICWVKCLDGLFYVRNRLIGRY